VKEEKVINLGITSLQLTLLVALFVLEYLSGYKAGLAQHLYFKKVFYVSHYYQGVPLILHGGLLLTISAMAVESCTRNKVNIVSNLRKYLILLTALAICFFSPVTRELNVYAHVLITLQLCILLEAVSLMLTLRTFKENLSPEVVKD